MQTGAFSQMPKTGIEEEELQKQLYQSNLAQNYKAGLRGPIIFPKNFKVRVKHVRGWNNLSEEEQASKVANGSARHIQFW